MIKLKLMSAITISLMLASQSITAQCNLGNLTGMTGTFTACPGTSYQYTVSSVTNATSYTWNLPPGATINGQNPFTSTNTTVTVVYDNSFVPPGNICVFANNNNCTVGPLCKTIISQGVPSGASFISGPNAACPGDLLTYSVTNVPGRTYAWTAPPGAFINSGQGSNQVTIVFGSGFTSQGNVCVALSNGCALSANRCLTVVRNIPPTPPSITGPDVVCGGNSATYSVATNPKATSYLWSVPAGATINSGQGTNTINITFPLGFTYDKVAVRYVNSCATSTPSDLGIRSVPATPQSLTGITAGLCGGSTTYTTPLINGATSYNWTTNNLATVSSGQGTNSVSVNFPSNYNTGKVCVTATNACGTGTPRCLQLKKEIDVILQPVNDTACYLTPVSFTAGVMGINLTYQWKKNGIALTDGGNISGSTTPSLSITPADSADFGNYSLSVNNGCAPQKNTGSAQIQFKYVPVTPSLIQGGNPATCPGTTGVNYFVTSQPDIDVYNWGGGNGVTIASGQGTNSILADFGPTPNSGYTIVLNVENSCGVAANSVTTWTRYSISHPTFVSGPIVICPGQSNISYAVSPIVGADLYTWTAPIGATIVSGQGTNSVTVDFSNSYLGGDLAVRANNICYTTPDKLLNVALDIPSVPTSITGQQYSACNTTLNYTTPVVNGATSYSWILPSGASIVGPSNNNSVNIQFTNPGNSAQICVTANSNCFSGGQRCIGIKARPEALSTITSNPSLFCANQTGVEFSVITPPVASTVVNWTVPLESVITSTQNNPPAITVNMGSTNGNVTATPVNSCSGGSTRVLPINFNCRQFNGDKISFEESDEVNFKIAPSPAKDFTEVKFISSNKQPYSIEVVDILGKIKLVEKGISIDGINEHKLMLDKIPSGVYIINFKTAEETFVVKLQVHK